MSLQCCAKPVHHPSRGIRFLPTWVKCSAPGARGNPGFYVVRDPFALVSRSDVDRFSLQAAVLAHKSIRPRRPAGPGADRRREVCAGNRSRLAGRQSYATSTISVRRTPTAVATKPRRSATTSLSGTRAILLISSRTASVSIRRRALARILGTPPETRYPRSRTRPRTSARLRARAGNRSVAGASVGSLVRPA